LNNDTPVLGRAAVRPDNFEVVVAEHWGAVHRLLHTLTGNTHDTEDLTQETFLRALNGLATFRPGTSMRTWLLRIASNAFFDVHRRRRLAEFRELTADPPGQGWAPEYTMELAEQGELLRVALSELPATARLVFHLKAVEGMPFREIAAVVGVSVEGARWHMYQARSRLRKRLAHLHN
jgi:RNA polymerase sigma-70 factor (ECF subfamily)